MDWIEERLLFELQRAVLRPEVLDYALDEFQRQLTVSLSEISGQLAGMRRRREDIQRELRNLVDTAARCGPSPALVDAISEREQELDQITQRLFAAQPNSVSSELSQMRQFVSSRLENIRELLYSNVEKAKLELAKHVTEIRMIPQVAGRKSHYIAAGEWSLMGGYAGGCAQNPDNLGMR